MVLRSVWPINVLNEQEIRAGCMTGRDVRQKPEALCLKHAQQTDKQVRARLLGSGATCAWRRTTIYAIPTYSIVAT